MATLSSDNYQLKWHSFGSHLHTSVATLFQSEQYTDTILCTADGHQLSAHRFLLSLCSVYFQNLFKVHYKPTSTLPLIVILPPDIDIKTLKTLIQYIYCGETTVSNEILENVLKAGDLLKIRGLWRPNNEEQSTEPKKGQNSAPTTPAPPQPATSKQNPTMPTIRKIVLAKSDPRSRVLNVPPLEPLSSSSNETLKNENRRAEAAAAAAGPPQLRTYSNVKLDYTKKVSLSADPAQVIKPIELKKPEQSVITSGPKMSADPKEKLITVVLNSPPEKVQGHKAGLDEEKYLVIKDEPIEWDQLDDVELSENELFQSEMTIKPEIIFSNNEEDEDMDDYQMQLADEDDDDKGDENYYSPLTCELCSEVFTIPAEWVRHIEGHSDLYQPAKRQRRGRSPQDDDNVKLPPLICDLCQKMLPTPAEWVRHIQQTHTEKELAASNNSNGQPRVRQQVQPLSGNLKVCNICHKRFPSHASMVIHARTHTGERPFLCTLCNKGFNVKSNLLRHLRTLHDKIINSTDVADRPEATLSE